MPKKSVINDYRLQISTIIVLPVFNEYLTLPRFIDNLLLHINNSTALVVVDDSKPKVLDKSYKGKSNIHIIESPYKQGRGAAVRQGMKYSLSYFPNITTIVEADSDGSHLVNDIIKIINLPLHYDLVIGTRYLAESQIINWPFYRRFLSFLLNLIIPKLIHVSSTDLTNGLRGYSLNSIKLIVSHSHKSNGFINLSEIAKIISNHKLIITEVPVKFVNRASGKSSITFKEIYKSIFGLVNLINFSGCDKCEF